MTTPRVAAPPATLRRALHAAGVVAAVSLLAATLLSWHLAPHAPAPGRTAFFAGLADRVLGAPAAGETSWRAGAWRSLHGQGVFTDRLLFAVAYASPLLLVGVAATVLLWQAWQRRAAVTEADVRLTWRWAAGFAVICVPAVPVLVDDFWLSLVWGRVIAAGGNPYYAVPDAATAGLPIPPPVMLMTYGPAWGLLSALGAIVTNGQAFAFALVSKLTLMGLWLALLHIVRVAMATQPAFERLAAVVLLGWTPLGVVQVVAEGHNDVAMMAGALLWLHLRQSGHAVAAGLALTLSVLCKYVTAPLVLIDALGRDHPRLTRRYVLDLAVRGAACAALAVVLIGPFFRDLRFFAPSIEARGASFYSPGDAVDAVALMTGWPLDHLRRAAKAVVPLIALAMVVRLALEGSRRRLAGAAAWVMLSMTVVGASHVWPWYWIWGAAFAALQPLSWLGRFAFGAMITMPFPLLMWVAWPHADVLLRFRLPSLVAYGVALAMSLLLPWRSRRVSSSGGPAFSDNDSDRM